MKKKIKILFGIVLFILICIITNDSFADSIRYSKDKYYELEENKVEHYAYNTEKSWRYKYCLEDISELDEVKREDGGARTYIYDTDDEFVVFLPRYMHKKDGDDWEEKVDYANIYYKPENGSWEKKQQIGYSEKKTRTATAGGNAASGHYIAYKGTVNIGVVDVFESIQHFRGVGGGDFDYDDPAFTEEEEEIVNNAVTIGGCWYKIKITSASTNQDTGEGRNFSIGIGGDKNPITILNFVYRRNLTYNIGNDIEYSLDWLKDASNNYSTKRTIDDIKGYKDDNNGNNGFPKSNTSGKYHPYWMLTSALSSNVLVATKNELGYYDLEISQEKLENFNDFSSNLYKRARKNK